jgi:predicted Zn-dependent protease
VTLQARISPISVGTLALLLAVGYGVIRGRMSLEAPESCDPLSDAACAPVAEVTGARAAPSSIAAAEVCGDSGYLCADLAESERFIIRRWKEIDGALVVHVPRPDFEDAGHALELQRAAVLGVRAWNNQPFPILVDTRGDREAHFSVAWRHSLSGTQIGMARTRWSPAEGLRVTSIELTTRNPFNPALVSAALQVRLTAAHEMGHALGLPHSDTARDVMYPTNTATAVSARDRRTMEVLYGLADGMEIVR